MTSTKVVLSIIECMMCFGLQHFALAGESVERGAFTIAIIGDSLTEGLGVSANEAYPAELERQLNLNKYNVKIINAGVSGATSASGLSRVKWVLKANPQLIVLALGANDGLRGLNIESLEKNLRDSIEYAQLKKVTVVLAGMKAPPNYGKEYGKKFEQIFSSVATKTKTPLLPFMLEGVAGEKNMNQVDGIHPNKRGHAKIASLMFSFMVRNKLISREEVLDGL